MSDYLVIRIPFNEPSKPEIVKFLAVVPIDWRKYLKEITEKRTENEF